MKLLVLSKDTVSNLVFALSYVRDAARRQGDKEMRGKF